ncbi:hypothetical protein ASPCAL05188 [Aspergillus calidoustus]|uniref:Uncharacterized protein n=1 Tax=Aspergillus calidoustus TaxID=454130 RepID=A0A0U5FZ42_ASPCI|nr:hypothetical protein ASPCAL05188 [Aspergillus calidoustus]
MGYAVLIHFVSHLEEDCLDDRQKSKDEKEHDWMYVILMAAAYLGRIRDLKHLITLGLDVNRNHEATWLYPPLIAASFGGQETAARVVVEHGADPHTVMRSNDSSNENAIHFAALFGHCSLIQFLVGHGVNPRLESLKSDTPRIWAAAAGNPDVVRILLTYYIDVPEKRQQLEAALDWAANRGYSDVVVEILRDPDSKYSHTAPLDSAPLAGAAIMGREDVVQALLSDPYVMGKECTIFRRALSAGETTTVRTMIDSNRKMLEEYQIVYSETALPYTVLHRAAESQDTAIVQAVLEHPRLDINLCSGTDTGGQYECALSFSIKINTPVQEIFEAIRAHAGVDVNIRDGADRTPLAATALKGQVKMMQMLLARDDVDRDPVDGDGNTLMHLALLSGKQSMVDFLLATRGTDFLRTRNRERQTPIALAVELEYLDIVKSMLNIVGGSARDTHTCCSCQWKGNVEAVVRSEPGGTDEQHSTDLWGLG